MKSFRWWFGAMFCGSVVRRGIKYAVVVGAILIGINHGDAIMDGDFSRGRIVKMALTVLVPFFVSALSSVGAMEEAANRKAIYQESRQPNS